MSDGRKHRAPLRNQRKLPSIPPIHRQPKFMPTYRGAIEWMANHQKIVDTALGLVEVHPKLIRTKACDRLFNFVSNIAFPNGMEAVCLPNDAGRENINIKLPEVPTISISRFHERGETPGNCGSVNKLYICGIATAEKWTKLVLSLSQNYFVQCTPEHSQDSTKFLGPMLQSDAFIFLMDNQSLCNRDCLEQLETALEWNVKIVFIREPNLRRPSSVLPSKRQRDKDYYNTKQEDGLNVQGLQGPSLGKDRGFSRDRNGIFMLSEEIYLGAPRPSSSASVSSCRSAPDLHTINNNRSKNSLQTETNGSFCSTNKLFTSSSSLSMQRKVDIKKVIQDGYNNALVYETNRHRDVATLLRSVVSKRRYGFEKTGKKTFLSTPPPSAGHSREHSPIEEVDIRITPEPDDRGAVQDNDYSDAESQSDQSSQETVYLIYTKEGEPDSPKVFHWPSDCAQEPIPNSPSIDSFGFEDIDLSKSINNLDLGEFDSD